MLKLIWSKRKIGWKFQKNLTKNLKGIIEHQNNANKDLLTMWLYNLQRIFPINGLEKT